MSALIIGDLHIGDRAPSSRKDSYADELITKLEWCVIYANHPGPGQAPLPMVFAGDVFHLKVPWRTSYGLVQRVHDVLRGVDRGVWIVPGNHDMSHDRLESLASQPLGALCRMGNVRMLMGLDEDLPGIGGIPWLGAFDGGDWKKALEPWLAELQEHPKLPVPDLVVTHAPLFPRGAEPGVYASIPSNEWALVMGQVGVKATYYGHIHEKHGTYNVTPTDEHGYLWDNHVFCNNGALSRGSLHEESVNRWPTITQWSAESGKFFDVPLPASVVKPPGDVFLFDEAAEKKTAESMTRAFEAALGEVKLANLTVEEVIAYIRAENPSPAVLKVVESALEAAGA